MCSSDLAKRGAAGPGAAAGGQGGRGGAGQGAPGGARGTEAGPARPAAGPRLSAAGLAARLPPPTPPPLGDPLEETRDEEEGDAVRARRPGGIPSAGARPGGTGRDGAAPLRAAEAGAASRAPPSLAARRPLVPPRGPEQRGLRRWEGGIGPRGCGRGSVSPPWALKVSYGRCSCGT